MPCNSFEIQGNRAFQKVISSTGYQFCWLRQTIQLHSNSQHIITSTNVIQTLYLALDQCDCMRYTLVLQPLYRSTCISRHSQLRTKGFCWCSLTARMPLLMAISTLGLGRKRWSSLQHCYLHCLRTLVCMLVTGGHILLRSDVIKVTSS